MRKSRENNMWQVDVETFEKVVILHSPMPMSHDIQLIHVAVCTVKDRTEIRVMWMC